MKVFYSLATARAPSTANSPNPAQPPPNPQPSAPESHKYTCFARLNAPVWVQLLGSPALPNLPSTEYGRLTLKTCLSAICISRQVSITPGCTFPHHIPQARTRRRSHQGLRRRRRRSLRVLPPLESTRSRRSRHHRRERNALLESRREARRYHLGLRSRRLVRIIQERRLGRRRSHGRHSRSLATTRRGSSFAPSHVYRADEYAFATETSIHARSIPHVAPIIRQSGSAAAAGRLRSYLLASPSLQQRRSSPR